MSQEHIQRQIIYKAIQDPIFAKETFSKLPTKTFNEDKSFTELALIINRYYQTNNQALDKNTFLVMVEEKLTKSNASVEKQETFYNVIDSIYKVDPYEQNEEVMSDRIQKYVRKTLIQQTLLTQVAGGNLEDENMVNSLIKELQNIIVLNAGGNSQSLNFFRDTEKKEKLLQDMHKNRFSTGFKEIDDIADGGLSRGELGLILAPYGGGKAMPNYASIKAPDVTLTHGTVQVGDIIYNPLGGLQQVIGVFPQGKKKVWEVRFTDGTMAECNDEHLWTYRTPNQDWDTASLRHIIDTEKLHSPSGHPRVRLPITKPVEYLSASLGVERSYALGKRDYQHKVVSPLLQNQGSIAEREAYLLGFLGRRPQEDLYALLRTSQVAPDKETADHLADVIRSLGGMVKATPLASSGYYLEISFGRHKYIQSIKETDREEEMTCIAVDGEEHLYLTDHFTVTHNTSWAINIVKSYITQGLNVLFLPLEELLDRTVLRFEQLLSQRSRKELMPSAGLVNTELYQNIQEGYRILQSKTGREGWGEFIIEKCNPRTLSPTGLEQLIVTHTLELGKPIDVVVVDYPDLMANPFLSGSDNESRAGGLLMEELRRIAQEYGFVCWTFSQLNRSGVASEFRNASMIEGSKQKLNSVEIALTINQTAEEKAKGYLRLYVDKLRNQTKADYDRMLSFKYVDTTLTIRGLTEQERLEHTAILADLEESVTGIRKERKQAKQFSTQEVQSKVNTFNQAVGGQPMVIAQGG